MRMFLTLAALLLIAACGPMYETTYQMVPPPTTEGKLCANNCLLANTNCKQQCRSTNDQCQRNEELRAENKYLRYVQERKDKGREIKRSQDSFYEGYHCSGDNCQADCENTWHLCHTNCGGQIIPHTICTAFCDGH